MEREITPEQQAQINQMKQEYLKQQAQLENEVMYKRIEWIIGDCIPLIILWICVYYFLKRAMNKKKN